MTTGTTAATSTDAADEEHRARRLWRALEPLHAVTYFAPEARSAGESLGLRGFWRGYFGQRAAPLGPVPAEVVTALFYNFAPGFVARSVPEVWSVATPAQLLDARLAAVDAALGRALGELAGSAEVAEAAELARTAATSVSTAGRALAAANAALPWPDAPHLVLWQAQTILREQRGDGHVAALVSAGIDPVEALVVFAGAQGLPGDWLRERRGWTVEEWEAARARLTDRGLVEPNAGETVTDTVLTDAGRELCAEVEARTDALADQAWRALGDARAERLVGLAGPLVERVLAAGDFLPQNPMGMRPLVAAGPG
ncbi:SCO6745 family protein [Pseudonocardia halophobica]|uniref:SCO6745 family protein n=1 Tax=Pseudonocardia halophobica TaxID=29401 RepID=UPI003D901FE5